jgi:pyruvate dehydrogenase E2 component (dihydrolipoamide acetyltransferase)
VNIALAMAVENAVVTAVIPRADRAGVADIAVRRRDLAERARAGRLQPTDIAGATFTISNLGMFEVDAFTAIIVPPQAAILAVGAIADRVVPVDGQPGVRPRMTMTLSCDHRVVDGARAAEFMRESGGSNQVSATVKRNFTATYHRDTETPRSSYRFCRDASERRCLGVPSQ